MPKNAVPRRIDIRGVGLTPVVSGGPTSGGVSGVTDHGGLTGLGDDDHPHYYTAARGDARWVRTTFQVNAGAGLVNGGALSGSQITLNVGAGTLISVGADTVGVAPGSAAHQFVGTGTGTAASWRSLSTLAGAGLAHADGVLAVGEGAGLTVSATAVALTTPGSLAHNSSNSATGSHTHAVSASSDVRSGVTALLKSASGSLSVDILNAGTQVWSPVLTYNGDLAITPTGNVTLNPGGGSVLVAQSDALRSDNYLAGFPMAGFRIGPTALSGQSGVEAGIGLFDELRARIFVADETRVDRGQEYITKSYGILSRNFTTPSTIDGTEFVFFENSPHIVGALFTDGDWVMFRYLNMDGGGLLLTSAWGQVYNYLPNPSGADASEQRWTFFLRRGTQFDAVAPNSSVYGLIFRKGAMAVNFGASGQGYILSDAVTATSPFVQIGKWTGNPYTPANRTVHTQIGRLDGVGFTGEHGLYAGTGPGTGDAFIVVSDLGQRLNNLTVRTYLSGTQTGFWGADGIFYLGTNVGAAATRGFSYNPNTNVLLVGKSTEANLYYDSNGLKIRQGASTVIALNSDGSSEFAGAMTIGTNGGIWQGEGTFASPTTGLKIWNQSGVGRIAGYNGGVAQWYAGTDGKLYAGNGDVVIDGDGISLKIDGSTPYLRAYDPLDINQTRVRWRNDHSLGFTTALWEVMGTTSVHSFVRVSTSSGITLDTPGDIRLNGNQVHVEDSLVVGSEIFLPPDDTAMPTPVITIEGANGGYLGGTNYLGMMLNFQYIFMSRRDANDSYLALGLGNTYNANSYLDLYAYGSTPTDYSARLIRNTGQNGSLLLRNIGTGGTYINNVGAGPVGLSTNNTVRLYVSSAGDVGIGNTGPSAKLHVSGEIMAQYLISTTSKTPTGKSDASGTVGEIRWDSNFIYVKTAAGSWRRVGIAEWGT